MNSDYTTQGLTIIILAMILVGIIQLAPILHYLSLKPSTKKQAIDDKMRALIKKNTELEVELGAIKIKVDEVLRIAQNYGDTIQNQQKKINDYNEEVIRLKRKYLAMLADAENIIRGGTLIKEQQVEFIQKWCLNNKEQL